MSIRSRSFLVFAKPGSLNATPPFAQEAELEQFHAPEKLLKEEEALHNQREARDAAEQAAAKEASKLGERVLNKQRFSALEQLLNQSQCYAQFLAEQMESIEEQTERDAKRSAGTEAGTSTAVEEAKGKGKRTRAGAGQAAKKAKPALTPTQVRV